MAPRQKCVMGCPNTEPYSGHLFPTNPKRRAEWCRILGVNPKQKRVILCSAHFSDIYIFGNRISKFAVPNPPKTQKLKSEYFKSYPSDVENILDVSNTEDISVNSSLIQENNINTEAISINPSPILEENDINIASDYLPKTPTHSSLMDNNEDATESTTKINTGDFEIRQRDTNQVIIQFRCIETSNSIMLSFITPQKYALQQQIKNLDEACSRQLKEIQEITIKNARLREKLKYYRVAMWQWRHVKPMNRYLSFKLKKFRQRVTSLKRRLKVIENDIKSWCDFWCGLNF
ncbi:hypothetical protein DOY81_004405 [Sarcophaga bullata]|nr:hypothetical protein DOY81_004405 [Sarcophaga bullata]